MAKKRKRGRVLDFLGNLPLWSSQGESEETDKLEEERRKLALMQGRLLEILNTEPLISAGRVQIIGLEDLKKDLGAKWESHRDSIHASLKTILRRKLGSADVYFQHGQDDYIIVFATLTLAAAKLVCASIMKELNTLLLGDDNNRTVTVRTAVGVADGRLLMEESNVDEVLKGLSAVSEEDGAPEEYAAEEGPVRALSPQAGDRPHTSVGWERIDFEGTLGRPSERVWSPINDDALDEDVDLNNFRLIYRPMWSPANETITTYTASFVGEGPDGQLKNAYSFVRGSKLVRQMDASVLARASRKIVESFKADRRFVMAVPHHYESVTNWSRLREYSEYCKAIPEEIRQYLALSCDDFPPGTPASKLLTIGNALSPYCRVLAANVMWTIRDLSPYRDAGFKLVGMFVPRDVSLPLIRARIEDFAEFGRRNGLSTAILNVHSPELAAIVRDAGIGFIMGRFIGDYQDEPASMTRISWDELLAADFART